MKRKNARLVTAALILALSLAQTSCGFIVFNHPEESTDLPDDTTTPGTGTTAPPETDPPETTPPRDLRAESEERLGNLVYRDLGASSVIVATAVDGRLICPSGETDSEVVAARTLMTRAVEEKYRTKIIANPVDAAAMLADAKAAYASDMYYADLLAIPRTMVGAFYAAGILANMYSLPFTDYSREYYSESLNRAAILGDSLLAVSGAATADPDGLSCVYFNRGLVGEDLYSLVKSGKWTLEKYAETAKAASSIDGVSGHGSDSDRAEYIDEIAASMGLIYVTNAKGQLPTLDYMDDYSMSARAGNVVDKLYSLIFSDNTYLQSGAYDAFGSGKLALFTGKLSRAADLADSTTKWGILPMPKFDDAQTDYYSPVSSDTPVFCALSNTPNAETSGLVLEALNAASYGYIEDIYFSTLRDYYLRDNQSVNMLGIILENPSSDFTAMMSSGFDNLAPASYEAVRSAVTSSSSLTSIYNRYATAAERELASSTVIY